MQYNNNVESRLSWKRKGSDKYAVSVVYRSSLTDLPDPHLRSQISRSMSGIGREQG